MSVSFHHFMALAKPFLEQYGYTGIFAALLLENLGMPLPGETMLIGGALAASQGSMSVFLVIPVALAACIVGDNLGYAIGRFGGRKLLVRFGPNVGITDEKLTRVEDTFRRRGGAIIVIARFVEVLRQLNGIAAGSVGYPWHRFLLFNTIGAVLWVGVWGVLVYLFGTQMEHALVWFKHGERWLLFLGLIVGAVILAWYVNRRRKRQTRTINDAGDQSAAEAEGPG
ncbi:DedA family protein [Stieleria magnilauensis]|uniref:Inner membrane protein YghB n=1 Tax=Stieleria magnilauensis TaxID=2527963 RepID=A0ABX5XY25_9BACT|nr:Inner membrane protein YghB [Planctomycetes bacterium TBK1r]